MIARVRCYQSFEEATEEWCRLGIDRVIDDAPQMLGMIIVFVEGAGDGMLDDLETAVSGLKGVASRCDSSNTKRLMIVGRPELFSRLSRRRSYPAANLVSSTLKNHFSVRTEDIDTTLGTMTFERTKVMGVLNVTPDSFSDGGVFFKKDNAVRRAFEIVDQGADIVDIGGESTRPFSDPVTEEVELERIVPVLEEILPSINIPVSIDTRKSTVARRAIELGAHIINDVSGLRDPRMIETVAELEVPVVLMHMLGEPKTMQVDIRYDDVVGDVMLSVAERMGEAIDKGVKEEKIMIDPGIGFGKEKMHNLEIIRRLREFRSLGRPIVIGPSRKAFIGKVLGSPNDGRLEGTLAAVAASVMNGANIVRVHDVKEAVRLCRMLEAIRSWK